MIAIGSGQGGEPVSIGAGGETTTVFGCDPAVLQPAIKAMKPAQASIAIVLAIGLAAQGMNRIHLAVSAPNNKSVA